MGRRCTWTRQANIDDQWAQIIWKHSFIRHAGDQTITALYSLVGLMSLTSLVLSIALYESKKLTTFLRRKFNVYAIKFETLLTVNIQCLKQLDHIALVHIAYYFVIENSKHSRLTHKITWTFSVSFLLDFTTSEFIPLLCSNFCFLLLFICLFGFFFRSALFSLSLDQANSLGKRAIIKNWDPSRITG